MVTTRCFLCCEKWMTRDTYQGLEDVRQRLLGYSRGFVARATGISEERLAAIEGAQDAPTIYELEMLSRLFGVDADLLAETEIRIGAGDAIEALGLLDEFQDLDDAAKQRVVAAANAARDVVELRRVLAEDDDPRREFLRSVQALNRPQRPGAPHEEGRHYAKEVRRRSRLGTLPIGSVRDLVATRWPQITVLYAELGGASGIAGLSFADALRGPTIVVNLQGKNVSPAVRRFSLAHELLHLLVDWNRHEPIATLSGFLTESALDTERRANAFAIRLLCPESVVHAMRGYEAERIAARLVKDYGLHYSAARLYIRNLLSKELPSVPPEPLIGLGSHHFALAEEPVGLRELPLDGVPPERRTHVARLAAMAWAEERISRTRFAEYLDVPPTREVERVLDFFELDVPAP